MKTILIVDDDKIISNIYKTRFRQEGFTAEVASDGEAAIAALQVVKPDLILLDLMLPKLSGLEVLKRLRQMEVFKSTPVIVLSNSYLTSMIQDAWKAGATKCLSKVDSNPKQVSAIVQDLLRAQSPASGSETQFFARGNQAPQITNDEGDRAFMAQLLQDFNSDAPKQIVAMRQIWGSFPKLEYDQERTAHLADRPAHRIGIF